MRFARHLFFSAVIAVCLLTGCSLHRSVQLEIIPDTDVELTDTPFFPQKSYQCGPAALAMALMASGVAVHPDDLTDNIYLPGRKGSLQLELIAAIRSYQRIPYLLSPEIGAVATEIQAGRPVLVLQNLGLTMLPIYHYAVAVGLQSTGQIVLRSGTTRRLVMDLDDFIVSWEKAGRWALIVLKPEELPEDIDLIKYLGTLAEIEATGNTALAEDGYRTLLKKYPDHPTTLFGLANTLLAGNQLAEAAATYREILSRDPAHAAATNNLAETLAGMHCFRQGLDLLDTFLEKNNQHSDLKATLLTTRQEIIARMQTEVERNTLCRE
ncbi:MAG: PA2778 family cysteine peptidase [Desulforhopalus sp.]